MILCRSSNESNSSNIDLLYSFGDCDIDLSDCVLEGVEIADNIVDLVNILLGEVLFVGSEIAREDTSVDLCKSERE